jgi:hypothetical protein
MNFTDKTEKKGKSIAFTSNTDIEEVYDDLDTREDLSEDIVLLGRQFNKILKRVDRRPMRNVKHIQPDINKQGNTSAKPKLMTRQIRARVFNVMNVKVMVTLELNVLHT